MTKFCTYTPEVLRYEAAALRARLRRRITRRERELAQRDLGKVVLALRDWGIASI